MNKKKKILFVIIFILLLMIVIMKAINIGDIIMKKMYPISYAQYVYKYSNEYGVDSILIFSIIKAESNFNQYSVSSSEAKGLMQLMDSTAKEIAEKIELNEDYDIFNPETNICLGTKYISTLLEYYDDNLYLSLAAYNAGIGNVNKWIEEGTIEEDGSDIENIPFKETRNYVRKIIRDYRIYQQLY